MRQSPLLAAALLLIAMPASAQNDPRIVEHVYTPDIVYPLSISQGHASVIQLQNGEAIESIVVGQADGWLVEPTASADRVVVKPLGDARRTNMTIVTTKRSYAFALDPAGGLDVFIMRFVYDEASIATQGQQGTYRFRGDRNLFPRLMSDNGRTTTIYWAPEAPFPAVFVVDSNREEIAASIRTAGDGMVIDGVHEEIVFRSGNDKARALRRAKNP